MKPKESGSIRKSANANGSGERIKNMGTQIKQLFLGKQSPNAGGAVAYSQSKRGNSNGGGAGSTSGANTLISTGMP